MIPVEAKLRFLLFQRLRVELPKASKPASKFKAHAHELKTSTKRIPAASSVSAPFGAPFWHRFWAQIGLILGSTIALEVENFGKKVSREVPRGPPTILGLENRVQKGSQKTTLC